MSYEGYEQYWCKAGHYWVQDCYQSTASECPRCRGEVARINQVDQTNGPDEGRIQPVLVSLPPAVCPTCGHCGDPGIYEIPTNDTPRIYSVPSESCERCGTKEGIEHIPCPYDHDVHGDDTLHWLCDNCADERARDI